MEASNPFHPPGCAKPVPSSRQQRRLRTFHRLLSSDLFVDFFPVGPAQIEAALEFLDRNFGRWDRDQTLAAWDYVLPALQKLFPGQKRFGFTAQFGPVRPARAGLVQWLERCVLKQPDQAASMAPG